MFPIAKWEVSHYNGGMETQLANHLLTLSDAFCVAKDLGESTVGRHCAADSRFFSRIRSGKTFTAKKYDEVVAWFSANWPDDCVWPLAVPRPEEAIQ
jgi:hypothetical protein